MIPTQGRNELPHERDSARCLVPHRLHSAALRAGRAVRGRTENNRSSAEARRGCDPESRALIMSRREKLPRWRVVRSHARMDRIVPVMPTRCPDNGQRACRQGVVHAAGFRIHQT